MFSHSFSTSWRRVRVHCQDSGGAAGTRRQEEAAWQVSSERRDSYEPDHNRSRRWHFDNSWINIREREREFLRKMTIEWTQLFAAQCSSFFLFPSRSEAAAKSQPVTSPCDWYLLRLLRGSSLYTHPVSHRSPEKTIPVRAFVFKTARLVLVKGGSRFRSVMFFCTSNRLNIGS